MLKMSVQAELLLEPLEKVMRTSYRRQMDSKAVALHGVSIALACLTFGVSHTCYRLRSKLNDENKQIRDLLVTLTRARKNWGFGLCFMYLLNVRGYRWNHMRINRIDLKLELNLRIKPSKRLKRKWPDALAVPEKPNMVCSMDLWLIVLKMAGRFDCCMCSMTSIVKVLALRWKSYYQLPKTKECYSLLNPHYLMPWKTTYYSGGNGLQYVSAKLMNWAEKREITIGHI